MVGLIRRLAPSSRIVLVLAIVFATTAVAIRPAPVARAENCAFPFTPTTYEDLKNRQLFLQTIDLAAFNMLFPGDPYFGLPPLETGPRGSARSKTPGKIPPVLLKAINWIESSTTQSAGDVPFGAIGPALVSFDCGHGIAQVTTGMTVPAGESGRGSPQQALVATHFAYNIARGAWILADKWNSAPEMLPIAGIDTNGQPAVLENWYFAIWAYNGFTGPGANRSNHPMDPLYGSWPRPGYSCGPTGDGKGHNRGNYPYQELVLGCATNPPVVDNQALWSSQAVSLPDLNNDAWKGPLGLSNFVFPYARMDIPTAQPFHLDTTLQPAAGLRDRILGSPNMGLSRQQAKVGFAPGGGSTSEIIDVTNAGTGVLAWYATASVPWLKVAPYTGVAVGSELPCDGTSPCDRTGHLEISVDATKAPPGSRTVQVTVQQLGSDKTMTINVDVSQVTRVGVPGVTKN